jgi:hypothetical protein
MIEIKTMLHEGITFGGKTFTEVEYSTGPRNLLKAVERLRRIREENIRAYGNLGCGCTWIEIDGVKLESSRFAEINESLVEHDRAQARKYGLSAPKSMTQRAKDVLASVA